MCYEPMLENRSYTDVTIMLTVWLDAWVATVLHRLLKRETGGGHRQKAYGDSYAKPEETSIKQLTRNVRELVNHWSWYKATGEEDRLSSRVRKGKMMGISRSVIHVRTLPSVERTFISVGEKCF